MLNKVLDVIAKVLVNLYQVSALINEVPWIPKQVFKLLVKVLFILKSLIFAEVLREVLNSGENLLVTLRTLHWSLSNLVVRQHEVPVLLLWLPTV